MSNLELLKEQSESENTVNNSNSSEQTESNTPIGETPMVSRYDGNSWFGTIGKYKATKNYETKEELVNEVKDTCTTWEDIAIVTGALYDYVSKEIERLEKELKRVNGEA